MDSEGNVAIQETPSPNNYIKLKVVQSTVNHISNWNLSLMEFKLM